MKEIKIFIAGVCSGNLGPGGYGIFLLYEHHRKELSDGYRWTTNNRIELYSLLEALEALLKPCKIEVISDSKYLSDAFNDQWNERWKKDGWRTSSKEDVQNRDLWEKVEHLMKPHILSFTWVKEPAEKRENFRCYALAMKASSGKELLIDTEFEQNNPFKRTFETETGGIPEFEEGYPRDEFGSREDHKKSRGRDWSDMRRRSRGG